MGLELVSLVLAVEERFEIRIPNDEAERLNTTRKVIDYVTARVSLASGIARECATQRAFYAVRRGLVANGISRTAVSPSIRLTQLLPQESRRQVWSALGRYINVKYWPELHRPDAVARLAGYGGLAAAALASAPILRALPTNTGLLLAIIATCSFVSLSYWLTRPFALHFSPVGLTTGDLAKLVASQRPVPPPPYTREEIGAIIRGLVTRELGVTSFTDDDDFVVNLGAG